MNFAKKHPALVWGSVAYAGFGFLLQAWRANRYGYKITDLGPVGVAKSVALWPVDAVKMTTNGELATATAPLTDAGEL